MYECDCYFADMSLPVYELTIDDVNQGVEKISLVDVPATGQLWIALRNATPQTPVRFSANEDRQILYGALMVPDQMIYRCDDDGTEYNVKFTAPVIRAMQEKFTRENKLSAINLMHETDVVGHHVLESWIVEDSEKDKAAALGMTGLPRGTWMIAVKINDKRFWDEQIKTGRLRGFSLEGMFGQKQVKAKAQNINPFHNMQQQSFSERLKQALGNGGQAQLQKQTKGRVMLRSNNAQHFLQVQFNGDAPATIIDPQTNQSAQVAPPGDYVTDTGVPVQIDEQGVAYATQSLEPQPQPAPQPAAVPVAMMKEYPLADGGVIVYDEETKTGSRNGEALVAGQYPLANGMLLIVSETGDVTEQAMMTDDKKEDMAAQLRAAQNTINQLSRQLGKANLQYQAFSQQVQKQLQEQGDAIIQLTQQIQQQRQQPGVQPIQVLNQYPQPKAQQNFQQQLNAPASRATYNANMQRLRQRAGKGGQA